MTAPTKFGSQRQIPKHSDRPRSADYSDEAVQALASWIVELPHLGRVLTEIGRLRPSVSPYLIAERVRELETEILHLNTALVRNREIGAATGILMARYRVVQSDAFHMLVRSSQSENRKLYDVAMEVLETGALPGKSYP